MELNPAFWTGIPILTWPPTVVMFTAPVLPGALPVVWYNVVTSVPPIVICWSRSQSMYSSRTWYRSTSETSCVGRFPPKLDMKGSSCAFERARIVSELRLLISPATFVAVNRLLNVAKSGCVER